MKLIKYLYRVLIIKDISQMICVNTLAYFHKKCKKCDKSKNNNNDNKDQ